MKKWVKSTMLGVIAGVGAMGLTGCTTKDLENIQFRYDENSEYVQYFVDSNGDWKNIITKGQLLEYLGDDINGKDGREVEFRVNDTHIQWRYVGENDWEDLMALEDIKKDEEISEIVEISYDLDGGSLPQDFTLITSVKKGETISILPTPTHESLEFVGWYTTTDGVVLSNDLKVSRFTPITKNVELKAVWKTPEVKQHIVKFFDAYGNLINSQLVKNGESAHKISSNLYEMKGFEFLYWDKELNNIESDTNIYGVYKDTSTTLSTKDIINLLKQAETNTFKSNFMSERTRTYDDNPNDNEIVTKNINGIYRWNGNSETDNLTCQVLEDSDSKQYKNYYYYKNDYGILSKYNYQCLQNIAITTSKTKSMLNEAKSALLGDYTQALENIINTEESYWKDNQEIIYTNNNISYKLKGGYNNPKIYSAESSGEFTIFLKSSGDKLLLQKISNTHNKKNDGAIVSMISDTIVFEYGDEKLLSENIKYLQRQINGVSSLIQGYDYAINNDYTLTDYNQNIIEEHDTKPRVFVNYLSGNPTVLNYNADASASGYLFTMSNFLYYLDQIVYNSGLFEVEFNDYNDALIVVDTEEGVLRYTVRDMITSYTKTIAKETTQYYLDYTPLELDYPAYNEE